MITRLLSAALLLAVATPVFASDTSADRHEGAAATETRAPDASKPCPCACSHQQHQHATHG
jgi:hypothetical protein